MIPFHMVIWQLICARSFFYIYSETSKQKMWSIIELRLINWPVNINFFIHEANYP